MRTFGTDVDNLILEEYHAGINRYNVILYHNGKKIDPYIKKLTVHFMGNPVPFGNISKHYFELNTDYMDFLEKDEVEVRIEKNSVEIKVCTFYIKTINKGEYMASYTAFSSLLEPEKIALYKIDEDPEWRVAWNNSAKTIKEILDIFLKPANLSMAEYPSYDGTFVSLHADWENMTLSQLICACGILEGCNYVLIGNTFYPVRPSKAVAKSYDIGECVYSENLWQRKTDLCCGKLDVGIKVWEYENYTSEDPLMGSVVSFMESSIEYNNPSSGTGVISANFPLIPGENSSKIKEYMISKLSPFIGMDMNSYTIEYLGDAFIEPGDKVKFYDDSRLVQFYPSEIIWEWDGGLRCTLKSEIVQESGTTEAEVSLKEIVNTINSVANTLQNVRYNSVTTKTLEADAANIGLLKAEQADIKYATIQSLNATDAKITALDSATIKTDELYSKVADLDYIKSDHADIAVIKNTMITTDTLKTEIAKIGYLTADEADIRYLTVSTANATFLHADMSDMDIAKIQTLFATAGIVSDMTIKDGHITGVLDSVTVNANSITTGTLSVDRLVIRGSEKSLVYELNNISGALQAKSVDTLNGEILTQRTITADKLVAKSITSNEIKTGTITSDEIKTGTITAANINMIDLVGDSAFINSLKTNTVIVGLQNDINGISVGGRNLIRNTANGFTLPASSSNWNYYQFVVTTSPLEVAVSYTVSFNVSFISGSDSKITVGLFNNDLSSCKARVDCPVSSGRVECVLAPGSEGANKLLIYAGFVGTTANKSIRITNLKLEKGNRATDWTPAPEDVDSLISAAQSTADSAKSVADSAVSTIGKWCYNNDITYINGGKIYTGTVTTDKLAADSVTADKILAGAITADKLAVDAITSRNYVKDTSGTKISLADGSYDSKYTKIDSEGKIECSDIKITGGNIDLTAEDYNTGKIKISYQNRYAKLSSVGLEFYDKFIASNGQSVEMTAFHEIEGIDLKYYSQSGKINAGVSLGYGASDSGDGEPYLELSRYINGKLYNTSIYANYIVSTNVMTTSGVSLNDLKTELSALQTNVATYYQPFGLGNSIKSGQNLNEFYSGVILGAGMGNAPNSDWWLVVSGGTGGTTVQRAYNLWNGQCYYRYCASGNWSGWGGTLNCGDITGTGAITISNGNMTSAGVITNALRMPTRASTQTTAKPNCYIDSNGNFFKTSTASSQGVKDNVKLLENEDLNPSKLYDVNIYQFKYKSAYLSNKEDVRYQQDMIGFILEDLFNKYPIAVDRHMNDAGEMVYDSWNEQYLIPAMLKLIQDQHMQLINQEMKIKMLEDKVMFM
jgi:hypothetical protein